MCDSGVAKFKTQFAGVRKLLALRNESRNVAALSAKTNFFTSMFAWFDSITASVNDREGQFMSHHLDASALADSAWSMENLTGCDGSLFRIVAKLARLNVLSQGKSVEENPTLISRPIPPISTAVTSNISPDADISNYDGNGWSNTMSADDILFSNHSRNGSMDQFWREWRETRHALKKWVLQTNAQNSSLKPDQQADLANISECFRHAALLYTERLGNPRAPCTDPAFQQHIKHSLYYVKLVKSDVYLLWPLFVTGSECVAEEDREVVRSRCMDIQHDSGFSNNSSCLGLLEAVWENMDQNLAQRKTGDDGFEGFRFANIMKRSEGQGEYIVV
jgi:hypothetical protein